MNWAQHEAISLCRAVEAICPQFNCHVALTGGLLYKDGDRKDCDILFYSVRGTEIDKDGLRLALIEIGFDTFVDFGFVQKTKYQGKRVDVFFPEHPVSDPKTYPQREARDPDQECDQAIDDAAHWAKYAHETEDGMS